MVVSLQKMAASPSWPVRVAGILFAVGFLLTAAAAYALFVRRAGTGAAAESSFP